MWSYRYDAGRPAARRFLCMLLLAGMVLVAGAAVAADSSHGGGAHAVGGSKTGAAPNAANQAYMKAMDSMHVDMMRGIMDPDPDTAFVRGMLPHHEGAVDMARIQLQYGKDPELRKLAQAIIDAQEKEIAFMKEWLKKKGRTP